jgi:hypothetical protein
VAGWPTLGCSATTPQQKTHNTKQNTAKQNTRQQNQNKTTAGCLSRCARTCCLHNWHDPPTTAAHTHLLLLPFRRRLRRNSLQGFKCLPLPALNVLPGLQAGGRSEVGWRWCSCEGQETEVRAPFTPPLRQRQAAMASHRNTATRLPPAHLVHCVHVPQRPPHHAVALEAAAEADLWVCECRWWGGVCVRNVRWWVEQRHSWSGGGSTSAGRGALTTLASSLACGRLSRCCKEASHQQRRGITFLPHHTCSTHTARPCTHLPHNVTLAHPLHALHKPKAVPHRTAAGVAVPAVVRAVQRAAFSGCALF